jgi:putative glutathione S-transferase
MKTNFLEHEMGHLEHGKWQSDSSRPIDKSGRFQRARTTFRNWITPDGRTGPSGIEGFRAEPGRYHLYVSWACPWAHRTIIFRTLKKLENIISISFVDNLLGEDGWTFNRNDGGSGDHLYGKEFLREIYQKADPDFTGRVSVPVLWDKKRETIVNNESAEIIRMLNSSFDQWSEVKADFYPEILRDEIDSLNDRIYNTVNNGVYRCGFARTQEAYEEAFDELFSTLEMLEDRLAVNRYLTGPRLTEADWRLFTTLVRFDPVYVGHFKCNLKRIVDYPNLFGFTRELYQMPGVAETVRIDYIKEHYYRSHESINPRRIVPKGPLIDYSAPHNREHLLKAA